MASDLDRPPERRFLMRQAPDFYARSRTQEGEAASSDEERARRAILARYHERRKEEVRRDERLEDGRISWAELEAIADGRATWPRRPARERA